MYHDNALTIYQAIDLLDNERSPSLKPDSEESTDLPANLTIYQFINLPKYQFTNLSK